MRYQVALEQDDEGGYATSVPGLPGCHSRAATESEALENVTDAVREFLPVVRDLTAGTPG